MKTIFYLFLGVLLLLGAEPATKLVVIDRPMPETHSSPRPDDAAIDTVMLHFSSAVVVNPADPYNVDSVIDIYTKYRASAHYLIDRDGKIYRLVPEERAAWHAGKGELPFEPKRKDVLNRYSIGIELLGIGSWRDMRIFMSKQKYDELRKKHPDYIGFTDAQYASLNWLIDDIASRNRQVKRDRYHIVGHEEYAPGRRTDPGETFDWNRLDLPKERPAK